MIEVKDCKSVWYKCLDRIREQVGEQSFKTWFDPIQAVRLTDKVLTIQVPSQFFYEWLEEHYVQVLRNVIDAELGPEGRLEYVISSEKEQSNGKGSVVNLHGSNGADRSTSSNLSPNSRVEADRLEKALQDYQLNPKYSFENYIEGDCNRLARSAGLAVADKPGVTSFNPLFVYGSVALGKTHLVQAIGNQIKLRHPEKIVLYVTSDNFANQFVQAVMNNQTAEFGYIYSKADVLIMEDVQFFSGKEKTQEYFFHIFNQIHQTGKQIILTSDCAPKDLKGMQERLLSRFKWGLSADLQQPDVETRMAIIKRKMLQEGVSFPDNVVEYLSVSVETNLRELEGVLINLSAQASLNNKEVDLELAKSSLQSIVQNLDTEVGIDYIQKFVADYFAVSIDQMKDKTRKREIVVPRQVGMFLAKEYTNMSLKSIGVHFGNRDHSTVIHAINSVNDLIDTDKKFRATMDDLLKRFRMRTP